MSFLKKLISGDLIKNVDSLVDNLTTTEEEKQELKIKFESLLLDAQAKMEAEISQRHANDMNSDSWLSKNVRPMTLVFVIVCTMLLIFIDAGILDFSVKNEFISLLSTTLVAIISFYFGSRGFEKIKRK
jgi:hypothetical protein|tara:strand:- start:1684 stop:2070 length:387 start_codon:yes stop_codon:yes gene_type:complete